MAKQLHRHAQRQAGEVALFVEMKLGSIGAASVLFLGDVLKQCLGGLCCVGVSAEGGWKYLLTHEQPCPCLTLPSHQANPPTAPSLIRWTTLTKPSQNPSCSSFLVVASALATDRCHTR